MQFLLAKLNALKSYNQKFNINRSFYEQNQMHRNFKSKIINHNFYEQNEMFHNFKSKKHKLQFLQAKLNAPQFQIQKHKSQFSQICFAKSGASLKWKIGG